MIKATQIGFAALLAVMLAAGPMGSGECDRVKGSCARDGSPDADVNPAAMDPVAFFDALVVRYKGLSDYHDSTRLTQITRRPGVADVRIETRLECDVKAGALTVLTPSEQLRQGFGLALPLRRVAPLGDVARQYDLWLAPHMTLRFCENPLANLREGVEAGFTPCLAERIVRNERAMVHLKLRSGDGLSEICEAEFDFYINNESMLIERIEGVQHLPDGTDYITTLEISPSVPSQVTGTPAVVG